MVLLMCAQDLRFGAGVSRKLFEELAVSLIPHQGELSDELGKEEEHKEISTRSQEKQLTTLHPAVFTFRKELTTSCSDVPRNGESPMKRMITE